MSAPARGADRGQSGPIGYILVFAVVISGVTLTVMIGGAGLVDTQSQSELRRAEHSMTLFDSRAAMVALGDADVQTVSLGQDSGSMRVNEDAGWMRVTHTNHSNANDPTAETEIIYNESLGEVVYENEQRTLAYQGGGVWRLDDQGEAQMVSPPEFHYRGATLTLPIVRARGEGSAGGSVDVTIKPRQRTRLIYPNKTTVTGNGVGAPYNDTGTGHRNYTNPVRNGTVNVTVQSQYYDAWANYFEKRTTGDVTKWDVNNTVRLQLKTVSGPPGAFDMPPVGDSVPAGGIGQGHPLETFEVTLDLEDNKPHFSFYSVEDNREFEIHVYSDVNPNSACSNPSANVSLSVYYAEDDGSDEFESWESKALDPNARSGLEWICDDGDLKLSVDFIESSIDMHYDIVGSKGDHDPDPDDSDFPDEPSCGDSTGVTLGNKYAFNKHMNPDCDVGWSLTDSTIWNQHKDTVGYEEDNSPEYTQGDERNLEEVTNHYLQLMGDEVDLVAKDGPGNSDSINEDGSTGSLMYTEGPDARFVTYLHITENEIDVDTG